MTLPRNFQWHFVAVLLSNRIHTNLRTCLLATLCCMVVCCCVRVFVVVAKQDRECIVGDTSYFQTQCVHLLLLFFYKLRSDVCACACMLVACHSSGVVRYLWYRFLYNVNRLQSLNFLIYVLFIFKGACSSLQ